MGYQEDFFVALRQGDLAKTRQLLDANPELCNMWEPGSVSPLHVATGCGNIELATLLIERGANLESQSQGIGSTPLKYAVFFGQIKMVRFLLQQGADPENRGGTSRTPLALALDATNETFRSMGTPGSDLDYARIAKILQSRSVR